MAAGAGRSMGSLAWPWLRAVLPRRKLNISTDTALSAHLPHPVKIHHLKPEPASAAGIPTS